MATLIERALNGEKLEDYEGYCGEVADMISHLAGGDIIHLQPADGLEFSPAYDRRRVWIFHIVARVNNRIYDAWYPGAPCTLNTYLRRVFPGRKIEVMVNGKTTYYRKIGRRPSIVRSCSGTEFR